MPVGNKFAESQGLSYVPNDAYLQEGFKGSTPLDFSNISSSGIMTQAPIPAPLNYIPPNDGGGGGDDDDDENKTYDGPSMSPIDAAKQAGLFFLNPTYYLASKAFGAYRSRQKAKADALADKNYKEQLEKDAIEMVANPNNSTTGKPAAYNYAGRENNQGVHTSTISEKDSQSNIDDARGRRADGGRAGYFFGGRVNYKAGGRIGYKNGYSVQDDMGDYAENVGKEAAPGGGFVGDGNNNPPSRFSPYIEKIFDDFKKPVDFGLRDLRLNKNIGNNTRLTSVLNTQKTLDDKKLAAEIELNNRLGGLETNLTFDTDKKPESNINFSKVSPFGTFTANANNIYGSTLSYNNNIKDVDVNATTNFDDLNNISISKFSGDPTKNGFSYGIGANVDPSNLSNSNAYLQARYAFGQGKKDGGRIGFKNGGLASIL